MNQSAVHLLCQSRRFGFCVLGDMGPYALELAAAAAKESARGSVCLRWPAHSAAAEHVQPSAAAAASVTWADIQTNFSPIGGPQEGSGVFRQTVLTANIDCFYCGCSERLIG